jgi:rhodanese-related sulfurtransferase/glutaredoxin
MKKLIFFILSLVHFSCQSQTTDKSMGVSDFEKGLQSPGAQLLDVRTASEYTNGHISKALQADWTNKDQFKDRISYMDKDKPVYVYCLSGARSAAAADWMRKNGFQQVYNLSGGINAWKKNDKPIEGTVNEKQMTMDEYKTLATSDSVVLVDFGAKWCPPCVKMEPVLEALQKDKSVTFKFVKIDASVHTDIQKQLAIDALPVFLIYKNGISVWRKQGLVTKEEFLSQLK